MPQLRPTDIYVVHFSPVLTHAERQPTRVLSTALSCSQGNLTPEFRERLRYGKPQFGQVALDD